jgi:hypothetical protein
MMANAEIRRMVIAEADPRLSSLRHDGLLSAHHRYYARRALKHCQIELVNEPNDWLGLLQSDIAYSHLTACSNDGYDLRIGSCAPVVPHLPVGIF